jgi:hypothetical protein
MKIYSVVVRNEPSLVEIQVWGDKYEQTSYAHEGQAIQVISDTLENAFVVLDDTGDSLGIPNLAAQVKAFYKSDEKLSLEGAYNGKENTEYKT